jgi:ribulose-5-phosphate 4-epimerase/fuculose-1-phosphate aldolase
MRNDALWQARVDLTAAYRLAALHGLSEGICNHLTLLAPGSADRFLLIPYGTHWSEVRARDLLLVDLEGRVIEGEGTAEETAFHIHAPLHRAYPRFACVMHTHMPYALALNLIDNGRILPINQNALRYLDRIVYDEGYDGLAFDAGEGERIARAMAGRPIAMLRHHGVIVCGPSVAAAYDDLYYLERTAMAQVLAMSTGRPLKSIAPAIAARGAGQIAALSAADSLGVHFAALKRLLDRIQPDYKD